MPASPDPFETAARPMRHTGAAMASPTTLSGRRRHRCEPRMRSSGGSGLGRPKSAAAGNRVVDSAADQLDCTFPHAGRNRLLNPGLYMV